MSELRQRRPTIPKRRRLTRGEREYERRCRERFKVEVLRLDTGRCIGATAFTTGHVCTGPLQAHHCVKQQWLRTYVMPLAWDEDSISEFLWNPAIGATLCEGLHVQHTRRIPEPVPLEWLPNRVIDFCDAFQLRHLLDREHPARYLEGERW